MYHDSVGDVADPVPASDSVVSKFTEVEVPVPPLNINASGKHTRMADQD